MRRTYISLTIICAILRFFPEASGQKILYPEMNPPSLRFENFQLYNGNGEPTTTCVYQDRKGFIWWGTEFGLYRFDGVKYRKFGIGRGDSMLLGYTVLSIFEDSEGNMWAGTYKALNRIDIKTGRVSHFIPDSTSGSGTANSIRLIREDRTGRIWLVTDRDIFTFNRKEEKFHRYTIDSLAWRSGHPAVVIETERFLEDSSGRIWIATDKGLYLFNQDSQRLEKIYPSSGINCLAQDSTGNILIGTEKEGLLKYTNGKNGMIEKMVFDRSLVMRSHYRDISAVFPEAGGKLWIFSNSTLFQYNYNTGACISYLISDSTEDFRKWGKELRIDKIFRGKDGKIWLINQGMGQLFQFDQKIESLNYFTVPRYVEFSFIEDVTGGLWFASVAQNTFRLAVDSLPYMVCPVPNSGFAEICNIRRISEDRDGNLWLALTGGIFKIRNPDLNPALKLEKLHLPVAVPEPMSICIDSKNICWFGFRDNTILSYNPADKQFKGYCLPSAPPYEFEATTIGICEDARGNIWFGTQYHGIYKLPPGGKNIRHVVSFDQLSGGRTMSFLMDFNIHSDGTLWIATEDGIYSFDPSGGAVKNFSAYNGIDGGFGSFNSRLVSDNDQTLWVLNSLSGPLIYNADKDEFKRPAGFDATAEMGFTDLLIDKTERIWLAEYGMTTVMDRRTGKTRKFTVAEKAGEISSFLSRSGRIFYIVNNKLLAFPVVVPANRTIPPVYITEILVNGKAYDKLFPGSDNVTDLKKAELRSDQNNLKIEFAALNYTHPELNRYRYYMEGIDIDTVPVVPGLPAEYKQMPPGRYKFWVSGANNDGVWNPEGVSLDIRILAPWYRTALAIVLYIILFAALVTGYIRFRIYSLQKDRIRLDGEVKARTAELEIKNRQLAETDRIKTHFFTDISHEIRTPLSLIIGPLETLSDEISGNSRLSEMIGIMARNAQRLKQLVDQLLDISRLDGGKMKINLMEDDILKCLKILVYEFLSLAESKQIKYIVELPDTEFITWFDRDKIEKIVSNLLLNAFRYTPRNGTVNCFITTDRSAADCKMQFLNIRVIDSGPGILPENQERIFERFFRVEGRTESEGHGSGIGLSLARDLARLLHGDVSVSSNPGTGSEFRVSLPLGKDHLLPDEYVLIKSYKSEKNEPFIMPRPYYRGRSEAIRKVSADGTKKILVIEDNEDLRSFIRANLSGNYQVLGAENGRIGINMAFSMMPDIIVTDILMPDIDGISLCKQFKNDDRTSHIPVIMLTAKSTMTEKLEGLRSGADDYIVKPFQMDELKVRIANLLSLREKMKYHPYPVSDTRNNAPLSIDEKFLAKVMKIIDENISNFSFDVGLLHERIGISRMHLTRKLKILTGLSPHLLIRNIRMEKAAELLSRNAGNITEVANSVGISNASGFSKAFREYFGVSPKKYSRQ